MTKINGRTTSPATSAKSDVTTLPPAPKAPPAPTAWTATGAVISRARQGAPPAAPPASPDGALGPDLQRAFPSFTATVNGVSGRVVPVDITGETLTVDVDAQGQALKLSAALQFHQNEAGMPILNMLPEPTALEVDGKTTDPKQLARVAIGPGDMNGPKVISHEQYDQLSLGDKTNMQPGRVLAQPLDTGAHTMTVGETLTKASLTPDDRDESLTVDAKGVNWFLRDSDLEQTASGGIARAASFDGAYFPSNFQFDRIPLTVRLNLPKAPPEQVVYSNGKMKPTGDGQGVEVKFPPGLTTSEVFLHVVPKDSVLEKTGTFKSIDGRNLKITTYAPKEGLTGGVDGGKLLDDSQKTIQDTLHEMEKLFGPYPHDSFVAQMWPETMPQDGGTGMEYAGATEAAPLSLRHETIHSYFGRSLSPADGNTGWLDEAVTVWLTDKRPTSDEKSAWEHDLTADTVYEQDTNRAGYDAGVNLLKDLDIDLRGTQPAGQGILTALQGLYRKFEDHPLNNDDFVQTMLSNAKTPEQKANVTATLARFGLKPKPVT